jgi:Putative zinc-finger
VISCADFLADLSNYVEGDVADELRAQLELHLSHCRSCTVLVDSTRKTIRILTDADCFELPQDVCRGISERIIQHIQNGVVTGTRE